MTNIQKPVDGAPPPPGCWRNHTMKPDDQLFGVTRTIGAAWLLVHSEPDTHVLM